MKDRFEHIGPTKIFIKYTIGTKLHCTDAFIPLELANEIKKLKSINATHLSIHFTNNPPLDHIT